MNEYILHKTRHGYYSISNPPSKEQLELFYANKYYQEDKGNFQQKYSKEELDYIHNEFKVAEYMAKDCKSNGAELLDIGCGQGYFSNFFYKKKWNVILNDFSSNGVKTHNPELLDSLIQGDCLQFIKNHNKKFNLININGVLEHLLDPVEILEEVKKLLHKSSILRITVPNDYSLFQKMLLENNYSDNTWLCPPEHLHYFNVDSLSSLVLSMGYSIKSVMTSFPIEQYLVNKHSNYATHKDKGSAAHMARITIDNFIFKQGLQKYINYYESCAQVNLGRSVILYAQLK
jgi:2-polyprenyl-3-methyl-5-hydroxy-6-metoxy-1,4-benzoquinol methylase